jgi:hypothetical protein
MARQHLDGKHLPRHRGVPRASVPGALIDKSLKSRKSGPGPVKHLARIDLDRKEEALWRAHSGVRKSLPKRINETLAKGRELVKEAKGTQMNSRPR